MQLESIDKALYRKRMNLVIGLFCATFIALGMGLSALLVALYGTPQGSNFWLNLTGVLAGLVLTSWLLSRCTEHPLLHEVMYVWRLKRELNRINPHIKAVLADARALDPQALTVARYYHLGLEQVYQLENNSVDLPDLQAEKRELEALLEAQGLTVDVDAYRPTLLERWRTRK